MRTHELLACLQDMAGQYEMQYDVIPSDGLYNVDIQRYPLALIVNTDPNSKPGKHWVVFYKKTPYSELEGFCR